MKSTKLVICMQSSGKPTFLEVGKAYLFRTVTMIYTGRIKDMRGDEILLEDAARIPETKRWKAGSLSIHGDLFDSDSFLGYFRF